MGRGFALAFAFNTAHHESTKFCPARLFPGRELATPLESVWDLTEANVSQDLEKEKGFWTDAIRNLRKARDQVARRYNAVRRVTPFKVGDVVVHRVKILSSKGKGVSAKLELRWSKPMVIAKFLKSNVVQLANAETCVVVRKAHECQLKKYHKDGSCQAQDQQGRKEKTSQNLGPLRGGYLSSASTRGTVSGICQ